MPKKNITLLLAVVTISAMQAQVSMGIRVGANFASLDYSPKSSSSTTGSKSSFKETSITGLNVAMPIAIRTSKTSEVFAIQLEPSFIQKGNATSLIYDTSTSSSDYENTRIVLNYVEIPILAKLSIDRKSVV